LNFPQEPEVKHQGVDRIGGWMFLSSPSDGQL
jgi:hypothetical protein